MIDFKDFGKWLSMLAEDRGLDFKLHDYDIVIFGKDNFKAIEVDFLLLDEILKFNLFYFKD